MPAPPSRGRKLRVVLFSGGRGSGALTSVLVSNPRVHLTVAINGYDDGASTGEVRRFLGDSLGPSDFRKNASRLSRILGCAPVPLVDLLDARLPLDALTADPDVALAAAVEAPESARGYDEIRASAAALPPAVRHRVVERLRRFAQERTATGRPFDFADCSVGNLVFAGGFLLHSRHFNAAVDDYCRLVGLPSGLIENVTDGSDAYLVAVDADGRLLGSEEDIVDAKRRNRIDDIFLLARRPTAQQVAAFSALGRAALTQALRDASCAVRINPRLDAAIRAADLLVYAPGTQHSSLFPSYLTLGLSAAVADNLTAIKLLVTNIQSDAEITGSSAVDIIERAVFYLKEKGRLQVPTPCLITHYVLNDPRHPERETPYVPLGRLDSLEDPRLVRVGNYEEGMTGRHDAAKILGPFVESFIARWDAKQRVAVLMHDAGSTTKTVQSILEMIRGGIRDLPIEPSVYHDAPAVLEQSFVDAVGFPVTRLDGPPEARDSVFREAVATGQFDYVILFESSGMYNGEDIANLASHLSLGRLDAVWGSRRLSVNDIHESYRLKYRHRTVLGALSYAGSHLLSLTYLALYGRYVSDTLSAVRVVRAADALAVPGRLTDKLVNQRLLSVLLGRGAEMFEVPVQFFALSPAVVRRTSPLDGLRALATAVRGRLQPRSTQAGGPSRAPDVRSASTSSAARVG